MQKIHNSFTFYNLEQILFQCADYYGRGLPDFDKHAKEKVNALIDRIDLPFFNPSWKEEAEKEAAKMSGVDLYDAATIAGDTFAECENGKFPDRRFLPWDTSGMDEETAFRYYVRMIAGIRSVIPA